MANAVGFDPARGDAIEVSSIAFGSTFDEPVKNLGDVITDYTLRLGKPPLNALLVFLS